MNTKQAFLTLINNSEYLKTLPVAERNKISAYKSQFLSGKLKLKNIDTLLMKHGFVLQNQPNWSYAV